jgi:AcrR family transcriptional regulator
MTTPSPSPQIPDKDGFSSLEPHRERRRRQLVRSAAHIVEFEGLAALRMSRVAELAGCTRTLVYRYFPSIDDLMIAVAAEYYSALEERFERVVQRRAALGDRLVAKPDADPFEDALAMLDVVFEAITEVGLAGLILRSSPHLSPPTRTDLQQRSARFSAAWVEPVRRPGLSALEAALVTEAGIALLVELVRRWQRDEISRDEALALCRTCFSALLNGLLGSRRP